ncbi:sensor domain-containing diguanylate cyclase [Pseudoalteromonas shioyasakiensis]|uniref:sensor domain-containing diguanylate cyclase n=1 Tax=Pseudoalteromonas TaxID=53246 RepID=UPI0010203CA6|nr:MULTISPECIES: diguanylate cyclase [Pseudoalteromonas]MCG9710295.1 sensor domain-containing diguanylate cyclase [Pseudoalteromonas sp. Isolate3]MCP4585941.1 GGDEF domain-containing protein [Pseudoalteromonas sp.]MCQ8882950.1 sensor domain-containing diguanylate cyclase [Pseudoalteromonas shioyasakiensis]QLE08331.1 GGDEF domain-containing protein [Pseudoalteromonas shioyasakiensis]QWV04965.1 sensor domain-containing diguanylate cyclase [Pseudoalteromonas shioyasakiensis]
MITRFILLFVIYSICLTLANQSRADNSPIVNINQRSIDLTQFDMSYFIDGSGTMPLSQVQLQSFINSQNKLTLGTNAKTTWSKIVIKNTYSDTLRLFVHNPDAYHLEEVSFYETQAGQLINQSVIQLDKAGPKTNMFGGSAVFSFYIAPNQQKTIYIKSVTFSHQWFALAIFDEEHSKRALVGNGNYIALLVGMMLALMIYNFFLYLSARKIENIVYALYLISGTVWVALSYGVAANFFGIFSAELLQLNSNLLSMPSFLVIFVMLIFETKKLYPKEHIALSIILFLLVADFVYSLFDIVGALKPASSLAALMMTVTFGVSISLWRKGNALAKYFLLGHSMFVIFNMLAVLYYKGISDANVINSHGVGIGILLEALMMAFILSYRIKSLEKIKAQQTELNRLVDTDPMTGLYNRRYFDRKSEELIAAMATNQQEFTLLIADLDHFKNINDTYGHDVGDKVIIAFANILTSEQGLADIACRYGGEEFVLLLNCNLLDAKLVAERIRQKAQETYITIDEVQTVQFTVSIGIHSVAHSSTTVKETLTVADKALYKAKSNGRNCVEVAA